MNGPELPNYTVSGTVYHSVTNDALPYAKVTIGEKSAVTDSLGNYSISKVLGGENHTLTVTKAYFETFTTFFLMGYEDLDSFDVTLGKMLYYQSSKKGPSPTPNGLAWTGTIPWASAGTRKRIYVLNENEGLKWVKYFDSPGSYPPKDIYTTPYGLTATEENGMHYLWISVEFETSPPLIYKMIVTSDTTLLQEARYDTPESIYGSDVPVLLDDLTNDGIHIWSCSSRENKIYKHGTDMSVMKTYDPPDERPSGIAWDGRKFWLSTKRSNRLYMLNAETLGSTGFYILQETPDAGLTYRNGFLWACKHGSQSWPSYFHQYILE